MRFLSAAFFYVGEPALLYLFDGIALLLNSSELKAELTKRRQDRIREKEVLPTGES